MRRKTHFFLSVLAALFVSSFAVRANDQTPMLLVMGAGGNDEYAAVFAEWIADWQKAATTANAKLTTIGAAADDTDAVKKLEAALLAEPKEAAEPLWLVLLGHGTATGGDAKFNLRGDDVTAARIGEWLKPFTRPVVIICAFSTSGAWLKPLAGPTRIIVTATRSASEVNFARFGGHLAKSIADPAADLDQDGQTSLLEAYIAGSRKTADWYAHEGRLATEHALLDDNGDGAGTPADWFKGVRAVKKPREGQADGARAHQIHLVRSKDERALTPEARKRRDELERELAQLRERKAGMNEEEYLQKLETLFRELARLYKNPAPAPAIESRKR